MAHIDDTTGLAIVIPKNIRVSKNFSSNLLLLPDFKINLTKDIKISSKIKFPIILFCILKEKKWKKQQMEQINKN